MQTKLSIFLLLVPTLVFGQDSLLLTKNFHFKDGIYLTIEEFKLNEPTFAWKEVDAKIFTNPQTYLTQVESVLIPDGQEDFSLETTKIFALCIRGIPYVRIDEEEIKREISTFAALKVRGKICYFSYPDLRTRKIQMSAYNPVNGLPFRTKVIERNEEVVIEKMLHFETGAVLDFNASNFLEWIKDDDQLVATVQELEENEIKEKLFKCLLIYDDRNNIYIKTRDKY